MLSKIIGKIQSVLKINKNYSKSLKANKKLKIYLKHAINNRNNSKGQCDNIIQLEQNLSKAKNQISMELIPEMLFIMDNKGYFIDCISNDEKFLLLIRKHFIGKSIFKVLPKYVSRIVWKKIKLVIKYGSIESFDYKSEIFNKDTYFHITIVKNNEKEIFAICRDITFKKKNESKLKISEERYKSLVNEMKQGLILFQGKSNKEKIINLRILDTNISYEKLTGLKKENILGKTISDVFPYLKYNIIKKIQQVLLTGKSLQLEIYMKQKNQYYEIIVYRPQNSQLAAILTDITERKIAEEALKNSEYNFRNIFQNSSDPILIVKNNKVIDCNLAMLHLLGYHSKLQILNKDPVAFWPETQPDGGISKEKATEIYEIARKNGKYKFEWWFKTINDDLLPVEVMMTTILNNGEKVFHSLCRDIRERKEMENKLKYLIYHDQLTGLYNRRFFEEELNKLEDEKVLPLTVVMADVNGLKLVNDSFGHITGDELLKKVGEVIKKGCRDNDIIARLGGDEFVILLLNTDIYETEQIVKNINNLASKETVNNVDISISFGWGTKRRKEEKIEDVIKIAEDYMYKKKIFDGPSMRGKAINTIMNNLYEKDKREEGHSHRVSSYCEYMGKALGLAEYEIQELKTVGLIHDIGKIAIEENILNKHEILTENEWQQMKLHPEIGYRIINTVNNMSEMAEHVLYHHERWDGKGYPKGVRGTDIPLQSRIISIVDAYDIMTTYKICNNDLKEEDVIRELKLNAGTQFDPELVKVFIEKVLGKSAE